MMQRHGRWQTVTGTRMSKPAVISRYEIYKFTDAHGRILKSDHVSKVEPTPDQPSILITF